MENLIISIAAPISTLIIALVGLVIAQKLGLGPKQQELVKTLQDLISAQKLKIDHFSAESSELKAEVCTLRGEVNDLKATIVLQAKEISKLSSEGPTRVSRRRRYAPQIKPEGESDE